jgi:hypothetical protein
LHFSFTQQAQEQHQTTRRGKDDESQKSHICLNITALGMDVVMVKYISERERERDQKIT